MFTFLSKQWNAHIAFFYFEQVFSQIAHNFSHSTVFNINIISNLPNTSNTSFLAYYVQRNFFSSQYCCCRASGLVFPIAIEQSKKEKSNLSLSLVYDTILLVDFQNCFSILQQKVKEKTNFIFCFCRWHHSICIQWLVIALFRFLFKFRFCRKKNLYFSSFFILNNIRWLISNINIVMLLISHIYIYFFLLLLSNWWIICIWWIERKIKWINKS